MKEEHKTHKISELSGRKKTLLYLVFAVFLILRLFVSSPVYFIGGDDAKYLTLAKHFPYHTLDNKSLFLLHGPIYPYTLHLFSYIFPDYIGGIIFSLLCSIVTFFVLYKLIMLLTKNYSLAIGTLALFTLSAENVFFANYVQKEAFMLMLFVTSIYFYLKGILADKKYFYFAAFFGAVTALTTDHVVLVLAAFAAAYFIFRKKETKMIHAAVPAAATILFYSIILLTRLYIYTHNEYYSTGVDGVIEKVSDFGVRQLFAPAFFPETMEIVFSKSSALNNVLFISGYMFNMVPFEFPAALDRSTIGQLFYGNAIIFTSIKLIFYLSLLGMVFIGLSAIFRELKQKKFKSNHNLFFLLIFLFFFFPVTQRITTLRMVLMSSIPLFYLIVLGFNRIRFRKNTKRYLNYVFIAILIFAPIYWIYSHNNIVLGLGKSVEASNTAAFLNSLPKDGIMAQVGYSPELNYQTDKRIISMPSGPENLNRILKDFDIHYLLYGERYWEKFSEKNGNRIFNYDTIKYIIENPQKFRLLKAIKEDYGSFGSDEIYVYEVVQ